MTGLLADIFPAIGEIAAGFVEMLGTLLNSIVALFYTAGVDGAAGSLTVVGWFVLVPVSIGLVYWGIGLFISFINKVRAKKTPNM